MADPIKTTENLTATQTSNESARKTEQANKARENHRDAASKRLDDENAARHKANIEAEQRRASYQPTPTQREIDLAKLGLLNHDDKEDDGSGPEEEVHGRRGGKYNTRDVTK